MICLVEVEGEEGVEEMEGMAVLKAIGIMMGWLFGLLQQPHACLLVPFYAIAQYKVCMIGVFIP